VVAASSVSSAASGAADEVADETEAAMTNPFLPELADVIHHLVRCQISDENSSCNLESPAVCAALPTV
jgi:hypothetical protein